MTEQKRKTDDQDKVKSLSTSQKMFKSNTGQCSMLRYYLSSYKVSVSGSHPKV